MQNDYQVNVVYTDFSKTFDRIDADIKDVRDNISSHFLKYADDLKIFGIIKYPLDH